jgi:hypothetical protein
MLVLRTSQPLCQSHPGPALLLSSIAAITITLPYRPLAGPPGLTAVPARILAALAALTVFYVITNEGPNTASHLTTRSTNPAPTVASDELIAQHTTRPAAISVLPAWQAASCSRGCPKSRRAPSRSSSPARTSSSAGGSGRKNPSRSWSTSRPATAATSSSSREAGPLDAPLAPRR